MSQCADILGPDGPFALRFAHYEPRTTQIEMATAVERAIEEERVLLCEAGTGTGKTLAYLLPALLSGKKVIVSTATRALQAQIVNDDLPWITEALGFEPRVATMKGLSNYVCRRRLEEHYESRLAKPRIPKSLRTIREFSDRSSSGDISHLTTLSEDDPQWADVTASSDTRIGAGCTYFDRCFVTQMRRQAEQAQLVVVNHHLFFADLALRGPHPGRVLPNYDVVIFDEAHQLEDIATEFFGTKISSQALTRLTRELARAFELHERLGLGEDKQAASNLSVQLNQAMNEYFDVASRSSKDGEGRREVDIDGLQAQAKEAWLRLDSILEALGALAGVAVARLHTQRGGVPPTGAFNLKDAFDIGMRRIDECRGRLRELMETARGRVVWTERTERGTSLTSSPIDLADLLRVKVFEAGPSVILTSATLTAVPRFNEVSNSKQFDYVRQRLGLVDLVVPVEQLIVASPFDYKRHALLYAPRDLPEPNSESFIDVAADRIKALISITGGGAFVLTTSLRSMHELYKHLNHDTGLPVLLQGSLPKPELLSQFRRAGNAVLVATSSFWEGVDVAGFALRLVVLEKIPFLVPSDPLVRARSLALEAQGQNPFNDYALPAAAIALKQGFGRLIRSSRDKGIVALLDERVHRRGYGQRLLASLPPAQRTTNLQDVRDFWAAATAG
jgi:ATP-dependent DNA helicase DinG